MGPTDRFRQTDWWMEITLRVEKRRFVPATVIVGAYARMLVSDWRDRLDELDPDHRHMLEGGSLSRMFLRYPLTVSHPVFVGGFYGLLIGLTLLLPYGYQGNADGNELGEIIREWGMQTLILVTMTAFLGGFSSFVASMVKRPPIRLENRRRYLFPFPFIGLILLSVSMMDGIPEYATWLGWFLLVFPGPFYVHLSYAPRWRILDRLDRGLMPFEGMRKTIAKAPTEDAADIDDEELDEVVEASG